MIARAGVLAILWCGVASAQEKRPPKKPEPPSWVRGVSDGLKLTGFIQVDTTLVRTSSRNEVDASGEPLNEERFTLRRGRIRADYEKGYFTGSMEIDVNTVRGPQVRPFAGDVTFRYPLEKNEKVPFFAASVGLIRIPFGFDVPFPARQRLFHERAAFAGALFPGFWDLGARMQGGYRFLRYTVAWMNGQPAGDRQLPLRDPNASKDLVARVGVETKVSPPLRAASGVSLLTGQGFHRGSAATKDSVVWKDANGDGLLQPQELSGVPATAATPSESFKRYGVGADLRLFFDVPALGELALMGEVVFAKNLDRGLVVSDPVVARRDVHQLGWYVASTMELTKWAQVGLRYDRYDPDTNGDKDQTYSGISATAALRWSPLRFVAQYDHLTRPLGANDDTFVIRSEVQW